MNAIIKKVFALLLTIILAATPCLTIFAEGETETTTTGTITVENAQAGETYTAYKIFDVTYSPSDNPTAYSYTIATDSAWLDTIITYMGGTKSEGIKTYTGKGLTLTLSANGSEYVVTKNEAAEGSEGTSSDTFSAADFAQALYAALYGYDEVASGTEFDSSKTYYIKVNNQYVKCENLTAFEDGVTYYTLSDKKLNVEGTELKAATGSTDGTVSADNLELGYYFVTTTLGSLADLTTTHPDVTIYDKNEYPTIDKKQTDTEGGTYADDALTMEVGETVYYQITGTVPSTTGYTSYEYKISDTLSEGLTFNKDVTVTINGTEITLTEDTTTDSSTALSTDSTYRYTDNGFEIYFDMTKHQSVTSDEGTTTDLVGATITVTYTAVVNDKAVAAVSTNTATLEYSNDPNDPTETAKSTDETIIYTSKIVIDKYASGAETTKLSDAKFVLYKTVTTTGEGDTTSSSDLYYQAVYAYTYTNSSNETVTVYSADYPDNTTYYTDIALTETATLPDDTTPTKGELVDINWVETREQATVVTTDEYGAAEFDGLEDGTYYLLETEAPKGYNLLTSPVTVNVEYSNTTVEGEEETEGGTTATGSSIDTTKLTYTKQIANSTGTELPETGGIGTTVFYILGGILIVGAGIILITRRRMNGER